MINNLNRIFIIQLLSLFVAFHSYANEVIVPVDISPQYEWTEYITINGIWIDYKFQECNNADVRNQVLVLFRYSNLTNEAQELSWKTKIFMDNECVNCEKLENTENNHTLVLMPNEVREGDGTSKQDKRMYIFSNFIDLVPGMSGRKLTDFEIVDLNVIQLNN